MKQVRIHSDYQNIGGSHFVKIVKGDKRII
ncbi:hypothetical protein SAMN05216362_107105 [Piscibacillus halophilus]|uniref:Uncharacterized protein n=1 Tax=Piscibacillus halophilus TaxID=571933 RepID=A0A1H9DSX0_9BACI|nr:hypothetical protein SAMN05216362_107105 [Piscibacillus halophilus]